MSQPGRSLDDLPLAAYSTGVDPETEPDMEEPVAPPSPAPAAPAAGATAAFAPAAFAAGPFEASATLAAPDDEPGPPAATVVRRTTAFARRNPRPVAGAAFVGMILVGVLLLTSGGAGPSAAGANASPSAPPDAAPITDPGSATLVLTGALATTYTLTGSAGQPVAATAVDATWADANQNVLTLDGSVDRGTRTTDAGLVLTWGVMVNGKLVTFTSDGGECTIGMAVTPKGVSGSFSCHKLRSDDGKYTVGASGTYRT
jgi:hypothetical protein